MKHLLIAALALTMLVPTAQDAHCQFWKKKSKKVEKKADKKEEKDKEYKKLMKDKHTTYKGLLTIHKFEKDNKILLEIPLSIEGKDLLLASTVSEISDNGDAVCGQKPHYPVHFRFAFNNHAAEMRLPTDLVMDSPEKNVQNALDISYIDAILTSFKIKAYTPDSTAVLVDATKFFTSEDEKRINPFDKYSHNTMGDFCKRSYSVKGDNCYVKEVKAFEKNITIKSTLTYRTSMSGMGFTFQKDKPVTVNVSRNIILLPEEPMRKRYADPRINIFTNYRNFYEGNSKSMEKKYFTNKWRLEPSDMDAWKAGKLVAPKQPIVFYIDSNYPESWKKWVKEGVEVWNMAFEKVGYKNAVEARYYPTKEEDPEFDPDNIKYSCLRYAPTPQANSMGPSWIDPRTGEIINASVYSFHNVAEILTQWRFIQTAQCDKSVRDVKLSEKTYGECLKYVISHEIGHCLGFMHNMCSSAAIPTDSLRSPSFTQKYGTTYSIMDYARFNYVAQPGDLERGVKLTPPTLGVYDYFSVKWLYSPIPEAKTCEEEIPVLDKWISEKSGDPIYRYGKQQLRINYDPTSQTEDLGDDVVKSSTYGIKNLNYIVKNLDNWLKDKDRDLTFRNKIYREMTSQYRRYMHHALWYLGGVYVNERKEGDAYHPYVAIPKKMRKGALMFLLKQINEEEQIDKFSNRSFLSLDIQRVQQNMNEFVFAAIMARIELVRFAALNVETKSELYSEKEYLNDIYKYIFKKTMRGQSLTEKEQKFQRIYINRMFTDAQLGVEKIGMFTSLTDEINIPADLSANFENNVALENDPTINRGFEFVRNIETDKIKANPTAYFEMLIKVKNLVRRMKNTGNSATRAHYELLLFKINKALDKQ